MSKLIRKFLKITLTIVGIILVLKGIIYFHGEWHFQKGLVFQKEDNLNLSLREYQKATFLNPNPKYLRQVGIILYIKGELEEALDFANRAIKISQNNPQNYQLRGKIFNKLEEFEKAEKDFKKAIELDPINYLGYWVDLAQLYLSQEKIKKADNTLSVIGEKYNEEIVSSLKSTRISISQTIGREFQFPAYDQLYDFYWLRGVVKLKMGEITQAEKFFLQAEEIKNTSSKIY